MARRLPTFKGYTIDKRLRQFRKLGVGNRLEFIAFDSAQGQTLIDEMSENPKGVKTHHGESPYELVYIVEKAVRSDKVGE